MADLSNQRRLASSLLKCGAARVWIDPARQDDIVAAVTRSDVRGLIKSGAIARKPVLGTSRVRARRHALELAKGRHRGPGSRRGSPTARVPRKEQWMRRIRAQRELLRDLRDGKKIPRGVYQRFYRQAKGGMFRSRAHLLLNLKLAGQLPEGGTP